MKKVLPNEGGWEYQYHLKDHLGNTRLTITSHKKTQEVLATLEKAIEQRAVLW